MSNNIKTDSRYIKLSKEKQVFYYIAVAFFVALFVMPQYFGLPFPLFDLTVWRIMIVIVSLVIIFDEQKRQLFFTTIVKSKYTWCLFPYLAVISYTMVLRADINAFLNPVIELYSLFLLVYLIKYVFGIKKTLKLIIIFTYILAVLGMAEYLIGKSPFAYLETIKGIYTGQFIRSGHYRIMGPCVHSLGYGLLLIMIVPFSCFNVEKMELNITANPLLFIMLTLNIVFTGSRSTLSVFFVEIFLIFIFSSKTRKKYFIFGGIIVLIFVVLFLMAFRNTGIAQYILLQISTIADELFGTEFSMKYGASLTDLSSSSNYRDQLKYIFQVDWLNPLLGLGRKRAFACEINGSFIQSVDNFYIAEFVRYAYPGMIFYLFFLAAYVFNMLKAVFTKHSDLCKMLLISTVCYMINLLWLDSLQTLKYLYVVFAIFMAYSDIKDDDKCIRDDLYEDIITKVDSKYIRRKG